MAHGSARSRAAAIIAVIVLICTTFTPTAADSLPVTDQTPTEALPSPVPGTFYPRYLSGIGINDTYSVFYEDRFDTAGCAFGARIYFTSTTSGAFGFSTPTATNICDTHLIVKDWPITIGANSYLYRAWGSVGNNPDHTFYVSNNRINWTQVYYGTGMFSDPLNILAGDSILYGFHDVVRINNNFMGFAESAGGKTYIVWSDIGDENWEVRALVGGAVAGALPLNLYFYAGITGPKPSGNFLIGDVGGQLAYTKPMLPGDGSGAYVAINAAAAQAGNAAAQEAAFLNPLNWTWRDGSTGLPGAGNALLLNTTSSGGHDVRELWVVPSSNPRDQRVVIYAAVYANSDRGLGCMAQSATCRVTPAQAAGGSGGQTTDEETETILAPATGFAPGRVSLLPAQPEAAKYNEFSSLRLVIPRLEINAAVVGVPMDGSAWDVTWLGIQAGWLESTAFPTWAGNSVLTGHAYLQDGRAGPFWGLAQLAYGDEVAIHAWGQRYIYEVRQTRNIRAAEFPDYLDKQDLPWLTLVTCREFDEASQSYLQRVVVRAVQVDIR